MHGIREAIIISTQQASVILVCCGENTVQRGRVTLGLLYQRITLQHVTLRYVTSRPVRLLIPTPQLDSDDYRMRDMTSVTDLQASSSTHTKMLQRERERERGRVIKTVRCGRLQRQNSSMYCSITVYDVMYINRRSLSENRPFLVVFNILGFFDH